MSTLPMIYLYEYNRGKVKPRDKVFIRCDRYHPDTDRLVVLSESPCKENGFQSIAALARYKKGKYFGVVTGEDLPVILEHTVWTECSIAEGPFFVMKGQSGSYSNSKSYKTYEEAENHARNCNM